MTISDQEKQRRTRAVAEARHSSEMEGLVSDGQTRADQDAYARGELSADELVERGRANVRAWSAEAARVGR